MIKLRLLFLFAPALSSAVSIVLSNDDGWAEKNIRVFYDALVASGQNVLISAPAIDRSGTGSTDATPVQLGSSGCEFSSCPGGAPAIGNNASEPRLNYVNAYPVTAMRYGIQNLSQTILGGPPDLAVSGFNVGGNAGGTVLISGTVGAASEAAKEGVPAIAFSGATGSQVGWQTTTETYQKVYADLSSNVTNTLIKAGKPYLPDGIWLNVNYPSVSDKTCSSASSFVFVLSRINSGSGNDVKTCGSTTLPSESQVIKAGCYASISVAYAANKTDASIDSQKFVVDKLGSYLGCLS
ncbi:acid phosphatase precursor [Microthyrium microscopicum]|uniref:Acid phosphatase n=1 Tax=Microthyrium microscopicum TaxID=703497 RepID=A0A6A6U7S5_9PEZI|nr:acid phosphatase precursor [Microthyrium microscopicum]